MPYLGGRGGGGGLLLLTFQWGVVIHHSFLLKRWNTLTSFYPVGKAGRLQYSLFQTSNIVLCEFWKKDVTQDARTKQRWNRALELEPRPSIDRAEREERLDETGLPPVFMWLLTFHSWHTRDQISNSSQTSQALLYSIYQIPEHLK